MQSLSGPITSSGCASPDLVEGLFQTRQPTQFCEWRNGVNGRDAVCYCGTNECNAKEMLENWIENGGGCNSFIHLLLYLETRKCLKDPKIKSHATNSLLLIRKKNVKSKCAVPQKILKLNSQIHI